MNRSWTFSRKLGISFLLLAVLTTSMAAAAILILRSVSDAKDEVIARYAQNLIDAQELHFQGASKAAASRAYLSTRNRAELDKLEAIRLQMLATLDALDRRVESPQGRQVLFEIKRAEAAHQDAMRPVLEMAGADAPAETVNKVYEQTVGPLRAELDADIDRFVALQQKFLNEYRAQADATASRGTLLLITLAVAFGGLAAGAALVLGRALTKQITTAVQQVESSSTELQAAAGQQASGAREQATAMSEVSTTISELLATSRQIAESAQRVAHIAGETSAAARSGGKSVESSQDAIAAIRRQVDLIVGHMLDLGKKSQQIGGILEIINELAEQTNILAINATIEAAGAGEAGRRFAVVADEIRKLADRVGGSTKDIRTLIDEIRASVNTTVMATEGGSKAVEAGARQIGDLAAAFKQIGDLVVTTTQAANEIELSTKQQATAVEQVNVAIGNVAQTSREAETTSSQSLQTVSQLAEMSRELVRLVRTEARV